MAMLHMLRATVVVGGGRSALRLTVPSGRPIVSDSVQLFGRKGGFIRPRYNIACLSGGHNHKFKANEIFKEYASPDIIPPWKTAENKNEEDRIKISKSGHGDALNGGAILDAVNHAELLELRMVRRVFEWPATRGALSSVKEQLEPIIIQRLKELLAMERTVEVALEIADLVYMLKTLGISDGSFERFSEKAGKGAMLLMEGARMIAQGQELIGSLVTDLSQNLH